MYDFSFWNLATSNVEGIPEFQKTLAVAIFRVNDFEKGSGNSHIALIVGSVLELKP
jgi:hypothetical protein